MKEEEKFVVFFLVSSFEQSFFVVMHAYVEIYVVEIQKIRRNVSPYIRFIPLSLCVYWISTPRCLRIRRDVGQYVYVREIWI